MRIIAHRGDSAHAPENTWAALRQALHGGAAGAEIDVRLTADGEVVLLHDDTLERTAGRPDRLSQLAWADARSADAGSWFGAPFDGEPIPRLADVLEEWPADRRLFIELKEGPALLEPLARVLARHGGKDLALLSFDAPLMTRALREVPGWPVHVDVEAPPGEVQPWFDALLRGALDAGWRGLSFGVAAGWRSAWPAQLHAAGLECAVWTVDDAAMAARLRDDGVDDLMTNDPGRLGRVLG